VFADPPGGAETAPAETDNDNPGSPTWSTSANGLPRWPIVRCRAIGKAI